MTRLRVRVQADHALQPGRQHLYRRLHSTEEALILKATKRKRLMRPFHAEVQEKPGLRVVRLRGELDAGDIEALRSLVSETGGATVWLDLSRLTFMDRRSFGMILHAKHQSDRRGQAFIMTGATGVVRRIFEVLGASELLSEHDRACLC